MTRKIGFPSDLDTQIKFFARFTVKDMLRIGLPTLTLYAAVGGVTATATGLLLGILWSVFRYEGQKLDQLAYNITRWSTRKIRGEIYEVEYREPRYLTTDDTLIGVIKVTPVNLEARTHSEQAVLQSIYEDLLNTVTYPITVHSRQHRFNLENYIETVEDAEIPPTSVRKGYINYCQELADQDLVTTDHYIVVRATAKNQDWLKTLLRIQPKTEQENSQTRQEDRIDRRCREIISAISTGDLAATRVTGEELDQFEYSETIHSSRTTPTYTQKLGDKGFGEYRKTFYLQDFPTRVDLGWTLNLLRINGQIDVTQVVNPQNPGKTVNQLNRLKEKLTAEINSFIAGGHLGTNRLESKLEDTNWLLELLIDGKDQPFQYGVYITVHDNSKQKIDHAATEIQNSLNRLNIGYQTPVFRTDQARFTESLAFTDVLDENQLVPTRSVAAGLPFATQDTNGSQGVIYGIDSSDRTPILLDRFSWSSYAVARFGMTGSGKTYATGIELLRAHLVYSNLRIIVVDPKQDYHYLIQRLGGYSNTTVQYLADGKQYEFDGNRLCFQPAERGLKETSNRLIELIRQLYQETSQNPSQKTLVVIDEAHNLMESVEGRRILSQWVREARDTNTALTLVSQNAHDFTDHREGRAILDNTEAKIFHYHERVPSDVVQYFKLSERQRLELDKLKRGSGHGYSEAIIKISGKLDTKIEIEAFGEEHAIIEAGDQNFRFDPEKSTVAEKIAGTPGADQLEGLLR